MCTTPHRTFAIAAHTCLHTDTMCNNTTQHVSRQHTHIHPTQHHLQCYGTCAHTPATSQQTTNHTTNQPTNQPAKLSCPRRAPTLSPIAQPGPAPTPTPDMATCMLQALQLRKTNPRFQCSSRPHPHRSPVCTRVVLPPHHLTTQRPLVHRCPQYPRPSLITLPLPREHGLCLRSPLPDQVALLLRAVIAKSVPKNAPQWWTWTSPRAGRADGSTTWQCPWMTPSKRYLLALMKLPPPRLRQALSVPRWLRFALN